MAKVVGGMIVNFVFLLATMALLTVTLPLNNSHDLLTYSSNRNLNDDGYDFSYSTDGQSRDEHAMVVLKKDGDKTVEYLEVRGSYSFVGDDNRLYTVNYLSGIDGYRANITITDMAPPGAAPMVVYLDPNAIKSLVG